MMLCRPRFSLEKMEGYSVETIPEADIIVNANETNWNLPASIVEEVQRTVSKFAFNRYPPMHEEDLSEALARDLRVGANNIILGNGSSELLEKACYAFGGMGHKIAIPYPSFSMYGEYVQLADSKALQYPLTLEGYIDANALIAFCHKHKPDLLIICNPNNPTGNFNSLQVMEQILARVECPVIMDEAYMEFAQGEFGSSNLSTLSLLGKYNNFMVFRTFSKAFGLASLRIGYGTGAPQLLEIMQKVLLPYHVNGLTLQIAQIVYANKKEFGSRIKLMQRERTKLAQACLDLGCRVFPSETNFLLVQLQGELAFALATRAIKEGFKRAASNEATAGSYVFKQLLQHKIMVRDFSNHPALPGALRITLGRPEENVQLISALTNICQEG